MNKHGIFHPAGGEISFRVNDRVTRVIRRSYAVGSQPDGCLNERPIRLWPHGTCFLFGQNIPKKVVFFHPVGGASQAPDRKSRNACHETC